MLTLVVGVSTPAQAAPVAFSTAGCFGVGCDPSIPGSNTIIAPGGSAALGFLGVTSAVDPATTGGTSNTSFGSFQSFADLTGGTFTNVPFTLQINQTVPGVGTGSLSATLNGMIVFNASNATLTFAAPQSTLIAAGLPAVLYSVDASYKIIPPSGGNAGVTTIQGAVSTVPEPATMMLLGTGLFGLISRRRKTSGLAAA